MSRPLPDSEMDGYGRKLDKAENTMDIIKVTDQLYNEVVDPYFERQHGNLEKVLAVTLEELAEFSWQDYLDEEALNGSRRLIWIRSQRI